MWMCLLAIFVSLLVATWIIKQDTGTDEMRKISDSIE